MNDTQVPANPATNPSSEVLEPSRYSQYLLHGKEDVFAIYRALIAQVSPITVFFNEGKDLLLTALLAADEKGLILDYGSSPETNRKAMQAGKLFCLASLDKVKIQFILRGLSEGVHEGRPAFFAPLPENLLRLQRREYFRLTMPITQPLVCRVPADNGRGGLTYLTFNAVDISGGGLALAFPPDAQPLALETDYPGCTIDLPEVGRVTATLRVRSVFEVSLRSGVVLQRAGCQFVNLPGTMVTLIQRYIIRTERERKARESGMT